MNLYQLIYLLPLELVEKIRKLTYMPQSINLTHDIRNYYKSKKILYDIYYDTYNCSPLIGTIPLKEWIFNDLELYFNSYRYSIYGYINKYYTILMRSIVLNNRNEVNKFTTNTYKIDSNITTNINIFWGLLLPSERNDMLLQNFKNNLMLLDFIKST